MPSPVRRRRDRGRWARQGSTLAEGLVGLYHGGPTLGHLWGFGRRGRAGPVRDGNLVPTRADKSPDRPSRGPPIRPPRALGNGTPRTEHASHRTRSVHSPPVDDSASAARRRHGRSAEPRHSRPSAVIDVNVASYLPLREAHAASGTPPKRPPRRLRPGGSEAGHRLPGPIGRHRHLTQRADARSTSTYSAPGAVTERYGGHCVWCCPPTSRRPDLPSNAMAGTHTDQGTGVEGVGVRGLPRRQGHDRHGQRPRRRWLAPRQHHQRRQRLRSDPPPGDRPSLPPLSPGTPPGWYPDPSPRPHEVRLWNGMAWTHNVGRGGEQGRDVPHAPAAHAWVNAAVARPVDGLAACGITDPVLKETLSHLDMMVEASWEPRSYLAQIRRHPWTRMAGVAVTHTLGDGAVPRRLAGSPREGCRAERPPSLVTRTNRLRRTRTPEP